MWRQMKRKELKKMANDDKIKIKTNPQSEANEHQEKK